MPFAPHQAGPGIGGAVARDRDRVGLQPVQRRRHALMHRGRVDALVDPVRKNDFAHVGRLARFEIPAVDGIAAGRLQGDDLGASLLRVRVGAAEASEMVGSQSRPVDTKPLYCMVRRPMFIGRPGGRKSFRRTERRYFPGCTAKPPPDQTRCLRGAGGTSPGIRR